MSTLRAAWRTLRCGAGPARLRALRDAQGTVRLAVASAALSTGVLEALRDRMLTTAQLAEEIQATDVALLAAWLRVLESGRYVTAHANHWTLASAGRHLLGDPTLRAVAEAFPGYHSGLYRDLPGQLAGGPARTDVREHGELIARLSRGTEHFVTELLRSTVAAEAPARVLDVGCGSGADLATMLEAAPAATGVGVEVIPEAADLAERTFAQRGVAERAALHRGELRDLIGRGALGGGYDIALYSQAIYYVPLADRVDVFRDVASLLSDRGVLLVVTTAAERTLFSRHFDLLLRAQGAGMELPDLDELADQLRAAGLHPEPARRLVPGQPLVAVLARRHFP
jgi:SAM-dependent methyltransferase